MPSVADLKSWNHNDHQHCETDKCYNKVNTKFKCS